MSTPNQWEEAARERKCRAMVNHILAKTVDIAKNADDAMWENTARLAGLASPPSETSRRRVIELLEGLKV